LVFGTKKKKKKKEMEKCRGDGLSKQKKILPDLATGEIYEMIKRNRRTCSEFHQWLIHFNTYLVHPLSFDEGTGNNQKFHTGECEKKVTLNC
jgi:hypothetical protein